MKPPPKVTKEDFDKLLIGYIRLVSKHCHLPKEAESNLLRQVAKKRID
jgi:hypothetical protein